MCSDQQAAELSAFVVTWLTDRITSEEVYWQPSNSYTEVEFGLFVDSIDYISTYSKVAEWYSRLYCNQAEAVSNSNDSQFT